MPSELGESGQPAAATEVTRPDVASGPRGRVIGRPSLGVLALCWGGVVGGIAFSWTALAQPPNDPSNIVPISLVYGVLMMALYLMGTTRVAVRSDLVELVSLARTYKVPFDQIAGVSTDAGFELVLVSGRRVGTMALGDSLIGRLMGQRRAHRVARRLQQLTGIGVAGPLDNWRQDAVGAELRHRAFLQAACLAALLVSGSVLLNLVY